MERVERSNCTLCVNGSTRDTPITNHLNHTHTHTQVQKDLENVTRKICIKAAAEVRKSMGLGRNSRIATPTHAAGALTKNTEVTSPSESFLQCAETTSPRMNLRTMGGDFETFSRQEQAVYEEINMFMEALIEAAEKNVPGE